ncbi:MAG: DegT/DnrJ/EryC1/StrS family aminotransferase [Pseudomonadota bacterium]
MINVTKTLLPPLAEYVAQLERVWQSGQVTNNGPLVRELEVRLAEYLGVRHVVYVANGTLGLQLAISAMGVKRKVITTPFSYVATTGALLWEHCTPVFVDIDPHTLCLDPERVEAAVDGETDAILAVHVYGHACDVEALGAIAARRGLRLIYDAAHAFGTRLEDGAVAAWGDMSVLSFHATKLFHTVEGGAIVTASDDWARQLRLRRAFGHVGDEHHGVGINAKGSELHAAMGLCMLPRIEEIIAQRRQLAARYDMLLEGAACTRPQPHPRTVRHNGAYYPVLLPSEATLLKALDKFAAAGIVPRRYFHPPLNRLPYRNGERCPVAEDAAARVMCLPMSHELKATSQQQIAAILRSVLT